MADTRITGLSAIIGEDLADGDHFVVVDVSDPTQAATGTTKRIAKSEMADVAGVTAHLADTVDAHDASAISVTPTGAIAATTVQDALAELDTEKASTGSVTTVSDGLAAHIGDTVDAHDASAISLEAIAALGSPATVQAAFAGLPSRYGSVADAATYGSGATDATAHIQALIDAASAAGGGNVIIPTGTFLISAGNLQMKSNVTLMGQGAGSVLKLGPSAANHLLRGSTQSRFRVTNLKLDGNDANQVAVRQALNVDNNDEIMIDHVWIVDTYGDGAQFNSCRDSLISDVVVRNAGRNGISITSTAGVTSGLQLQNIHVDAAAGHAGLNGGIDLERGDDVQIRGLRIEGPFLYGVVVKGVAASGCARISLTDVHISSDVTTYGILLDGTAGTLSHIDINGLVVQDGSTLVNAVRVLEVVNDWTIANFVIGSSTGASANAIFTGQTTTPPGPGVIGPGSVKGSWTSHGIAVRASGTVVHGVRVTGAAGSGVQVVSANDVTISGCRLTGNTRYGVETTGTSDRTVVVGNSLNGNTIGASTAVGASNVIASNAT